METTIDLASRRGLHPLVGISAQRAACPGLLAGTAELRTGPCWFQGQSLRSWFLVTGQGLTGGSILNSFDHRHCGGQVCLTASPRLTPVLYTVIKVAQNQQAFHCYSLKAEWELPGYPARA